MTGVQTCALPICTPATNVCSLTYTDSGPVTETWTAAGVGWDESIEGSKPITAKFKFTLTGTASGNAPHTHPVTLTGGGHSHTYSKFGVDSRKVSGGDGVQIDENNANRDVGGDGSHTHSSPTGAADATTPFSGTATVSGATHGHGVSGTTGSHGHPGSAVTGTGTHPHTVELSGGISEDNSENLPPYFALFYIMRII